MHEFFQRDWRAGLEKTSPGILPMMSLEAVLLKREESMLENSKDRKDRQLDRSLDLTFPASDPVAPYHITGTEPLESDPSRMPAEITEEQVADAQVETVECPYCHGSGRVTKSASESNDETEG
jgi:hypothetical protein